MKSKKTNPRSGAFGQFTELFTNPFSKQTHYKPGKILWVLVLGFIVTSSACVNRLSQNASSFSLPPGVIFSWAQNVSQIPKGWVLSNGNGGTVNLVDVYIKGTDDGNELAHIGGTDITSKNGAHTPSISTTGTNTWSLNPHLGLTKFNAISAHDHQLDPIRIELAFMTNTAAVTSIPAKAIAFWGGSTAPAGWKIFDPSPKQDYILFKGSKTPSTTIKGSDQLIAAGEHVPTITVPGGTMSLNPGGGSTSFDTIYAHTHDYRPEYFGLTAIECTKTTTIIPKGLIVPWVGAPASVPKDWVLVSKLDGRLASIGSAKGIGGDSKTSKNGGHTPSISLNQGGHISLNPKGGQTIPNDIPDHDHTVADGPKHVKLPFIEYNPSVGKNK